MPAGISARQMLVVARNNTKMGDVICFPAAQLNSPSYPRVKGLPPGNYAYESTTTKLSQSKLSGLKSNYRKLLDNTQNKDDNNKQRQLQSQGH